MIAGWVVILVALLYMSALFAIAHFGDQFGEALHKGRLRSTIYALTLAVYCTSWTFFGSVGLASLTGLDFLGIYLGPILMIGLGHGFVRRVVQLAKSQNILSIADFVSARYGKSARVAALVAFIAVIGSIPYIALQLKAITVSLGTLIDAPDGLPHHSPQPASPALAFIIAIVLAGFTTIFGTRHIDSRQHHTGLTIAVAFESAVKLAAFLAVGIFVVWSMFDGPTSLIEAVQHRADLPSLFDQSAGAPTILTMVLLSFLIILLLPRQFHMTILESRNEEDSKRAAWMFPAYLILINLFVVPIAVSSNLIFPPGMIDRDMAILELPLKAGNGVISLIVFLGGLSAATAMVVVECVALATMISNDLVSPLLPARIKVVRARSGDLGGQILTIRRIAILVILLLGYIYFRSTSDAALASIGLISFTAIAQIAPAFFGGLFWRRGTAIGAMAGMISGTAVWFYTLVLPSIANPGFFGLDDMLRLGPFGLTLLKPTALFDVTLAPIAHGAFFSLATNTLLYVLGSLIRAPKQIELVQASYFVDSTSALGKFNIRLWRSSITVGDLKSVIARYLGSDRTALAFSNYPGILAPDSSPASIEAIHFAEHQLASAIGAASSRRVLSMLLSRGNVSRADALQLLDDASIALQQNRDLLQNALDHSRQGVTVFDANRRLLCWNRAFQTLFNLPESLVQIGTSLEDIISYNADNHLYGPGRKDRHIRKRLESFIRDTDPVRIKTFPNGRWLEIRSTHLPDGGIVTTYTDMTDAVQAEESLSLSNQLLESRVRERTEELLRLNRELNIAKQEADGANLSKTRFLAAASHDILQPLNAARLYSAALIERIQATPEEELSRNVSTSLEAVEEILTTLLDISRLDAGAQSPEYSVFSISEIFSQLRIELDPVAKEKGLTLDFVPTSLWVRSDKRLLRRMVQNLISNALKYTLEGRVLVGCRRQADSVLILVIDTGVGIPLSQRALIFQEFSRLEQGAKIARGLGLGLAIVERISKLLSHPVSLRSTEGKGTEFSIAVPRAAARMGNPLRPTEPSPALGLSKGLNILVIDNEETILDAMRILLEGWGCRVVTKTSWTGDADSRSALAEIDLVIADYHLDRQTGLDVIKAIRDLKSADFPALLITADRSKFVRGEAAEQMIVLLHKPVRPAALRSTLVQISTRLSK